MMKILAIFLLVCVRCIYSDLCTELPVAEGSKVVIKRTVPTNNITDGNVKWMFTSAAGSDVIVTECSFNNDPPCTNLFASYIYSSTMNKSGSNYEITLTTKEVNTEQATWKWTDGNNKVIGQCDLNMYYLCTKLPVHEGSEAVIRKTVPTSNIIDGNVKWMFTASTGSDVIVSECFFNNDPPCTSLISEDSYSSAMKLSGSNYEISLTMYKPNITRDKTKWKWADGNDHVIGQCDLDMYSFQSAPVCQDLEFSSQEDTVSWTCTLSNVYPRMGCRFSKLYKDGDFDRIKSKYVKNKKEQIDGTHDQRNSVYFNQTCTLDQPINGLNGDGKYSFKFVVFFRTSYSKVWVKKKIVKKLELKYSQEKEDNCHYADNSIQRSEKDGTTKEWSNNPLRAAQRAKGQGKRWAQDGDLILLYNSDVPSQSYFCSSTLVQLRGKRVRPPFILSFTANSQSRDLTVTAGDSVTFVCTARGNPLLNVDFENFPPSFHFESRSRLIYFQKIMGTMKNMKYEDTGTYYCVANNGVRPNARMGITIIVKEVPGIDKNLIIEYGLAPVGVFIVGLALLGIKVCCLLKDRKSLQQRVQHLQQKQVHQSLYEEIRLQDYNKLTTTPDAREPSYAYQHIVGPQNTREPVTMTTDTTGDPIEEYHAYLEPVAALSVK